MLKFIDLEQSDLTWRSIIYNLPRGVLSFTVRSSIDFLPTLSNLKCWGKRSNAHCQLCKNNETLCHVVNNCSVSLNQGRYTWRHDSILRYIVQLLQYSSTDSNVKMYVDISDMTTSGGTIPANILPTSQRPDMFLYNESAKKAVIAELTVPFEPNIPKAHEIKQSRNAALLSDLSWNLIWSQILHSALNKFRGHPCPSLSHSTRLGRTTFWCCLIQTLSFGAKPKFIFYSLLLCVARDHNTFPLIMTFLIWNLQFFGFATWYLDFYQ